MKLIGSMTEQAFRDGLVHTRRSLLRGDIPNLREALYRHFPDMVSAFILGWTPEQLEDIYVVMIDDQYVASLEIGHDGKEARFDFTAIDDYSKTLSSRKARIRLAVALDIFAKDSERV